MSQPLDNLIQSLQDLKSKAETMAAGGDLESLIEESLVEVNRQCYETCLDARRESAACQPAAFSPSGVSAVRRAAASERTASASGSDASRRSAL